MKVFREALHIRDSYLLVSVAPHILSLPTRLACLTNKIIIIASIIFCEKSVDI